MAESASQSKWTLDGELKKIAHVKKNVAHALHKLKLLSQPEASFQLHGKDNEWVRSGAETYIFRFKVSEHGMESKDVIIKACVAYMPGGDLNEILASWIHRRKLLREHGVETPQLYGWGHGVIIEEYVPYELSGMMGSATGEQKQLLEQLTAYASAIYQLGFAPIDPFRDLRSRGRDVVAVDFGQDLGPPQANNASGADLFEMLVGYLVDLGVSLSTREENELRAAFVTS